MELEQINAFLKKCSKIQNEYYEELNEDGANFNVFSILGLNSKEVRLHSTFLAELLNPKGTHALDEIFLQKFVELLKNEIKNNDTLNNFSVDAFSKVEIEKPIGTINKDFTEGGRIDIFIDDNKGNLIIIENKIYAGDQLNQLLRYDNYSKNNSKNYLILYLTLNGKESTEQEVVSFPISYEEFILIWLEKCLEWLKGSQKIRTSKKNKISETISQYHDIIKNYLIPSNQNAMTEQIKNIIKENGDIFKVIPEVYYVHQALIQEIKDTFWEIIHEKYPWHETIFEFKDTTKIKSEIYDDGGFYYGFSFERDGDDLKNNDQLVIDFYESVRKIEQNFKLSIIGKIWTYGIKEVDFNDLEWVYSLSKPEPTENFINKHIFPDFENFKNIIIQVAEKLDKREY